MAGTSHGLDLGVTLDVSTTSGRDVARVLERERVDLYRLADRAAVKEETLRAWLAGRQVPGEWTRERILDALAELTARRKRNGDDS